MLRMAAALLLLAVPALGAMGDEPVAIVNGGFENAQAGRAEGWSAYETGYVVDESVRHTGDRSIRCENAVGAARGSGALQTVVLNQKTPAPIVVSGWSRAMGVDGAQDGAYSIYLDLIYADGTPLWGQTAAFSTGTHDWERQEVLVVPSKPVAKVTMYALFRNHAGTAWFDDFSVRVVDARGLFDNQALKVPRLPGTARSGWFVRDVAAFGSLVPLFDGRGRPTGEVRAQGLTARLSRGKAGEAMVTVTDLRGVDRAVTVYYVETAAALRLRWWTDLRTSEVVPAVGERANLVHCGVGVNGLQSLYPFGCVTGKGFGRAVGVPPWLGPRVSRIAYNAGVKALTVAFDVALSTRNRAGRDAQGRATASVAVASWAVDPAWGFRSAAERYYRLYPQAFQRRAKAEGLWMPFTAPSSVKDVRDFHFAYHEGDNDIAGDNRLGILAFRYTEPMTYWMPMGKDVPRTFEAALAMVRANATGKPGGAREWSEAVLNSGSQASDGRFNVEFQNTPWTDGAVWVLNPNPRLLSTAGSTKATLSYTPTMADRMYGPEAKGIQSGEYLDSLEGWSDVLDFRPESIEWASVPPAFTQGSCVPVIPTWFSAWELARYMGEDLHRRGKLLMANATPWRFHVFAPLLDVMGTETNWNPAGQWRPDSDAVFNLRRTLCYHRPYLLLQNTDFRKFDAGLVERYFRRCMFYAVFPSMFSADASTDPYWEQPALYNRDRPLFLRYIPVISALSSAGWEPVTHARSTNDGVWLERYGRSYLTVLSPENDVPGSRIGLDLAAFLDRKPAGQLRVTDVMTGATVYRGPAIAKVTLSVDLAADVTRVLKVEVKTTK